MFAKKMKNNSEIQRVFWNSNFEEEGRNDSGFSSDAIYFKERFINGVLKPEAKKVLEIGCGNGMLTFFLLKRDIKITAIDISEKAIENLGRWFEKEVGNKKLNLVCGDLMEYLENSGEKFDVIIGSGIIHHVEKKDREKLFRLAYEKLNPGGIFACGPEPNAGGLFAVAWRFAKIFYKIFGMEYDWEVEKETLNMKPHAISRELKSVGFENFEIEPFQCIPHFHLGILGFIDKKIINHIKGKFSFYITVKGEKMRSISASKYDADYYQGRYENTDQKMLDSADGFDHIYKKSASLIKLKKDDRVVDLGCGTGQMPIYLNYEFGCDVAGIDYSQQAIDLCHNNLQKFINRKNSLDLDKIKFICCDNRNLPDFSAVKVVFLLDFLEHLYPEEIDLVLEKTKKWNDKKIYLVIRTDNKYYLKFVRPIGDLVSIYFGGALRKNIEKGKKIESEKHINIMAVADLKKRLKKHGFSIMKIEYPEISAEMISRQFNTLGKYKALLYSALLAGKLLYFLRPSFYIVAKYTNKSYESSHH
jgi:cyclopropane fatty-acyl-phospholipid synthase-like methyltransferase